MSYANTKDNFSISLKFKLTCTCISTAVRNVAQGSYYGPYCESLTWFCGMNQIEVLLLPSGWDASLLQGYCQQYVANLTLNN